MSIEKLDSMKIKKANIPFTMISTNVLQSIKDVHALALYVYLCSLPSDWIIQKEHIKKHFGLGDARLKSIFSYFIRAKLLCYTRERRPDGTLEEVVINLLCGDNFDENEPYIAKLKNKSATGSISTPVVTTGSITTRVVTHTSGAGALQKKYKDIKEIKEKKVFANFGKSKANEPKQTAKFWAKGHPDYDRNH
jgi:hypothetical protein